MGCDFQKFTICYGKDLRTLKTSLRIWHFKHVWVFRTIVSLGFLNCPGFLVSQASASRGSDRTLITHLYHDTALQLLQPHVPQVFLRASMWSIPGCTNDGGTIHPASVGGTTPMEGLDKRMWG